MVHHFLQMRDIKEERKFFPPKFIKSMLSSVLIDTIQGPQFPDLRSPLSRWLSRSRRAFRLFFAMAHELQSFNRNLFCLYCFLKTLLVSLEEVSAWVPGAVYPWGKRWSYWHFKSMHVFSTLFMVSASAVVLWDVTQFHSGHDMEAT